MKTILAKAFCLLVSILFITSCTKDPIKENPVVEEPKEFKYRLKDIWYPSFPSVPLVTQNITYTEDQITGFDYFLQRYKLDHFDENQMVYEVTDLLYDKSHLLEWNGELIFNIKDDKINYIKVFNFTQTERLVTLDIDSFSIDYKEDFISNITHYKLENGDYKIKRKTDWEYENGNISKIVEDLVMINDKLTITSQYSYDNEIATLYSNYKPESPLFSHNYLNLAYILAPNKLGKMSKNNLTKCTHAYSDLSILNLRSDEITYNKYEPLDKSTIKKEAFAKHLVTGVFASKSPDIYQEYYPSKTIDSNLTLVFEQYN